MARSKEETQAFLKAMNARNSQIADETKPKETVGEDPFRLQRQAERREKLGPLRARRKKAGQVRSVFGYTSMNP